MAGLASAVKTLQTRRAALAGELEKIDHALEALRGLGGPVARGAATRRKGGKWRKGHPGRPPRWFVEKQRTKGARKPAKRKSRRKRKASAKQLAAMAKAREALAAKRAAAK
jgi:hypothetical protein